MLERNVDFFLKLWMKLKLIYKNSAFNSRAKVNSVAKLSASSFNVALLFFKIKKNWWDIPERHVKITRVDDDKEFSDGKTRFIYTWNEITSPCHWCKYGEFTTKYKWHSRSVILDIYLIQFFKNAQGLMPCFSCISGMTHIIAVIWLTKNY